MTSFNLNGRARPGLWLRKITGGSMHRGASIGGELGNKNWRILRINQSAVTSELPEKNSDSSRVEDKRVLPDDSSSTGPNLSGRRNILKQKEQKANS